MSIQRSFMSFFPPPSRTTIFTLSLHDALPIFDLMTLQQPREHPHGLSDADFDSLFTTSKPVIFAFHGYPWLIHRDRKSTRLNSSHITISYAVFCLKKKKDELLDRDRMIVDAHVHPAFFYVFFSSPVPHHDLHSFPTRRSSDLRSDDPAAAPRASARAVGRRLRLALHDEQAGHLCLPRLPVADPSRSEEHTSELQSHHDLVCRLLLEKKKG